MTDFFEEGENTEDIVKAFHSTTHLTAGKNMIPRLYIASQGKVINKLNPECSWISRDAIPRRMWDGVPFYLKVPPSQRDATIHRVPVAWMQTSYVFDQESYEIRLLTASPRFDWRFSEWYEAVQKPHYYDALNGTETGWKEGWYTLVGPNVKSGSERLAEGFTGHWLIREEDSPQVSDVAVIDPRDFTRLMVVFERLHRYGVYGVVWTDPDTNKRCFLKTRDFDYSEREVRYDGYEILHSKGEKNQDVHGVSLWHPSLGSIVERDSTFEW